MKTYQLEYFTSRNTTTEENVMAESFEKVLRIAKRLSFSNELPIIARDENDFAKYEHGKCEESTNIKWLS
jgi:hypothetical protein